MKTEKIQVELRVLKPTAAENWLTNGETFSQEVYLGACDSADNWREITPSEREELELCQRESL